MRRLLFPTLCILGLSAVSGLTAPVLAETPQAEGLQFYEVQVRPLLEQHCFKCHGVGQAKGGLTLASRESILKGGETGPAVNLQDPDASVLIEALNYASYEMPPSGKLPAEKIAVFKKWLELGLPMPAGPKIEVTDAHGPPQVNEQTKNHWSFKPLVRPEVPQVQQQDRVRNPIDAFVLAKLEAAGLTPGPAAPPQQLLRRLHYDLVGLPPSKKLIQQGEQPLTDAAYTAIVEQLLNSPHHGEQYARYWLDLVRYGETNSYERDNPKPFVWRYRDYVIDFFNSRRGYDEFIREQLAGDELLALRNAGQSPRESAAASSATSPELLIATGYYRLGLWDDEPADPELAFFDGIDDLVGTTSQAFLGLTMNCARCHDHKLDPLPQADYYSFAAFFRNIRHYGRRSDESVHEASLRSIATPEEETAFAAEKQAWETRVAELRRQLDEFEARVKPHLKGGENDDFPRDSERLRVIRKHIGDVYTEDEVKGYADLRKQWTQLKNNPPRSAQQALCITEQGAKSPVTHVLLRGNPQAHGAIVEPTFPTVLSPPAPNIQSASFTESTGRRLALADWIASPDNPLTARVMVNRIWQWHFGRGLVESANDFGLQGTAPTHPELLDWLAAEFIEHDWSLRHLHELILTSNTYRQSSAPRTEALAKDPQNRLFWRFDMRRLRAEELRDSILAANNTLDLSKLHGPSIYPTIEKEVLAGQSIPGYGWHTSSPEDARRRSVYIHIKRSLTVPLLANFDVAEADVTCPVRFATTQPTQALTLLNSQFLQEQSQIFADMVREAADDQPFAQTKYALERVLQREPTLEEITRGVALMDTFQQKHKLSPDASLKYLCLTLLNLNEFIYLD